MVFKDFIIEFSNLFWFNIVLLDNNAGRTAEVLLEDVVANNAGGIANNAGGTAEVLLEDVVANNAGGIADVILEDLVANDAGGTADVLLIFFNDLVLVRDMNNFLDNDIVLLVRDMNKVLAARNGML